MRLRWMKPAARAGRPLVAAATLFVAAWPAAAAASLPPCRAMHWVSAWSNAPAYRVEAHAADAKLRMIVRPNTAGERARVRLSNRFGSGPVSFSSVRLARRATGASLVPGSSRPVLFGGAQAVTIPAGQDVTSDPLAFAVPAREDLAVSMAVTGKPERVTSHQVARTTSFLTVEGAGDRTADDAGDAFTATTRSWFYVAGVDVQAPTGVGTLAAVGDSITDGFQGRITPAPESDVDLDTNARWPDFFATRIGAGRLAVTNVGIGGNRVLRDAFGPGYGPSLLSRLEADVLRLPGLTDVVVLEGINDIGQGAPGFAPALAATAPDLIAGYTKVIERLHAVGVRVHLGTLTPAGGTVIPTYGGEEPNERREAVNAWIRSQKLADGVIDFDAALRDPSRPSRLLPAFDSSDHLHPSTAGYRKMASVIDPAVFAGGACGTVPRLRFYGRRKVGIVAGV